MNKDVAFSRLRVLLIGIALMLSGLLALSIDQDNPEFDNSPSDQGIDKVPSIDAEEIPISTKTRSPAETTRSVLVELFTGTWCPPCQGGEGALDTLANEYPLTELSILEYHLSDSYTVPGNDVRDNYYSISGVPTAVFDGIEKIVGGSTNPDDPGVYNNYKTKIENRLPIPSPVTITVTGSLGGGQGTVSANITAIDDLSPGLSNLKARFVVYEDHNYTVYEGNPPREYRLRYTVVENLPEEPITLTKEQNLELTKQFTLDAGWDLEKLGVVVFVQADSTKEILQTTSFNLSASSQKVDYTTTPYDISFSNPTPYFGEIITIYATIHNVGNTFELSNVYVRFYDGDPGAGGTQIGTEQSAGIIGAGLTATVWVDWNTTGSVGVREIVVVIDPGKTIFEPENENNNVNIKTITVPDPTLDYITVTETPNGLPITAVTLMPNGDSALAYASGYNNSGPTYIGLVDVGWSGGGGVWAPTSGTDSTFTTDLVGGLYVQTALDTVSGKSDTFNIEILSIDVITITDTPDGNPLGTIIMGVGGKVSGYVSAYNSSGSIYLGLLEVDWSGAGGNWSPLTGNNSEFTAGAGDGLFVQTAFFSALGLSDTFEVNILTAVVDYIQIRSLPFGAGDIVTDIIFDVGQSKTLWAAAYNLTYGFLGDREAIWTEDTFGNIITVTTPGYSTLVQASDLYGGGATVTTNVNSVQNQTSVTVNPPIVNYILIRDSPGGGGKDLCDIGNYPNFPVGHTTTFYGAQYNYTAGYLGIVPGTSSWDSSDYDLVELSPFGSSSTITCNETTGGAAIITLDDGLGHDCATVVTILQPTVDYVIIRDSPDGLGLSIGSPFYDVSEEKTFYAAGYNDTAGYLYDVSVTWECTDDDVGNITGLGESVLFEAVGLGTCEVSAEYTGIEGETGTITVVDITPPLAIIGPMGTMYEDETYTFDASSSGDNAGISDYHWSFGDGQTYNSPEPDADHIFREPGTYTVTLTVTDLGGNTAVDEIIVVILDVTPPAAICNLVTAEENVPCSLDGGDSYDNVDIVLYTWEFGDGRYYESQYANVTHIYDRTGNYTVNLTVWDAAGHVDTTSSYIVVEDLTPPSTPKGLAVELVKTGEALTIKWNANLDEDLDHYELYCSQEQGEFTKIADIDAGIISYKHEGLENGKSYRYYVIAVDTSDNPSSDSAVVEGIPDVDTDEDGIYDIADYDDDDDGLSDIQETQTGSDPLNPDSDDDSHLDGEDAFPIDAKEWKDTDRDGHGDSKDAFPRDADEWKDADGDGIGDNIDFVPIHDLLFYLIISIIVILAIVGTLLMMKRQGRRKAEALSSEDEQSEAPSKP